MRSYLFLDAGSVRACYGSLAADLKEDLIEFDIRKAGRDFERIFYYEGMPSRRDGQTEDDFGREIKRKEAELLALGQLSKVHVRTGTTRYRKKERGLEQKGVDVLIAIDMLRFATQRHMDHATLWSSDLDMYPALEALTETRTRSTLLYSTRNTSSDLIAAADDSIALTCDKLLEWSFRQDLIQKHKTTSFGDVRPFEDQLRLTKSGEYRGRLFELYEDGKTGKLVGWCEAQGNCTYAYSERAIVDYYSSLPTDRIIWT